MHSAAPLPASLGNYSQPASMRKSSKSSTAAECPHLKMGCPASLSNNYSQPASQHANAQHEQHGSAPENGVPRAVGRKVHQRAKGVARPPVVHVAHDGAQVRKLRLLHQVAHCRRGREGRAGCQVCKLR